MSGFTRKKKPCILTQAKAAVRRRSNSFYRRGGPMKTSARLIAFVLCLSMLVGSAAADYVVSPNSAPVNLRQEPSQRSKIIGQIVTGTWVSVLVPGTEWTKITYRDTEGYIRTEYLTSEDPIEIDVNDEPYMYIVSPNSAPVNVRKTDSDKSKIIAYLVTGTEVKILEPGETWVKIEYGGTPGYVRREYVQRLIPWTTTEDIVPGNYYYIFSYNSAPVNLRSDASRSSKIVTQLVAGTMVKVLDVRYGNGTYVEDLGVESVELNSEGWAHVETEKGTGYVMLYYLTTHAETSASSWYVSTKDKTSVNMRYGAGKSYAIVTTVPYGSEILRFGTVKGWARVKWGMYEGYISEEYLSKTQPEP